MKFFKLAALFFAASAGIAQAQGAAPQLPSLFIIGDSTVKNGTAGMQGWGTPIADYFGKTKINVYNRALGGRSSRTFYTEGLWDAVAKEMKPGDFVLMQFGHNDGGSLRQNNRASLKGNGEETEEVTAADGKKETVHTFGWYMRRYVADAKAKGATPIVLSLIPRNDWNGGKVSRAAPGYGQMAKDAAEAGGAAFVDLNEITARRYEEMGEAKVKELFPNEHTHTSPAGAAINAASVVAGLKGLKDCALCRFFSPKAAEVAAFEAK